MQSAIVALIHCKAKFQACVDSSIQEQPCCMYLTIMTVTEFGLNFYVACYIVILLFKSLDVLSRKLDFVALEQFDTNSAQLITKPDQR